MTQEVWQLAIEKATKKILEHPQGVVCKHWMLCCLFSELEEIGFPQTNDFVKAIVQANDEKALENFPFWETPS